MKHARTIAMATTLLADGRAEAVVDMVDPLLDPVTAPATSTGQILLRGLRARVEIVHRDHAQRVFELLPEPEEASDLCTCVRAEVALWRGWAHARRSTTVDEATRALRLVKESQELFASICDPMGRCWALLGQARACYALEEYGLMRQVLDEAESLLDELQDTQAERWLHELRIPALRFDGQYERAEKHVEALRSIAQDWNDRPVQGHATAHAAALLCDQGAAPSAIIEEVDTAASLLRQDTAVVLPSLLRATRAHVGALCQQREWEEALGLIDDADSFLSGDSSLGASLQTLRARVALRRGHLERALSILDDLFDRTLSPKPGLQRSSLALLYGEALLEQDRRDEAQTWFRRAHRTARETGHRVDQWRTEQILSGTPEEKPTSASSSPSEIETASPIVPDQAARLPASSSVTDPTDVVDGFVAESSEMKAVADEIRRIHPSHSPILLTGERGTGKGFVARAIHEMSTRADGPLERVSCAPTQHEEPLEARFFGTVDDEGTWTPGAAHAAEGGTLVIEDIDALPLSAQSSLLHLLDTGHTRPTGDTESRPVDVRIIATTTADLDARVREGRFREALRNRLRVISFHVPPLRERRADIPLLARHFLDTLCPDDSTLVSITQPAMEALLRYNWPGNVRQLRNEIERAYVHVQSEPAPTIDLDVLLDPIVETAQQVRSPQTPDDDPDAILEPDQTLSDVLSRTEKAVIERVLRACDGQITASADVLGLTRQGLYKKMKRLDIDASAFQASSSDPAPASP